MTAKTRAIPSLHRDSFPAKVPRPCPVLTSGNTTSPYCRAVRRHSEHKMRDLLHKIIYLDTCILFTYRDSTIYQILFDMAGLTRRSLAYDNSRFCFLKFTKPVHEHHLQVLPILPSLVLVRLPGFKMLRRLTVL